MWLDVPLDIQAPIVDTDDPGNILTNPRIAEDSAGRPTAVEILEKIKAETPPDLSRYGSWRCTQGIY